MDRDVDTDGSRRSTVYAADGEVATSRAVADGRRNLGDAWWVSTLPAFPLRFTILAFDVVGDAHQDPIDPRREYP